MDQRRRNSPSGVSGVARGQASRRRSTRNAQSAGSDDRDRARVKKSIHNNPRRQTDSWPLQLLLFPARQELLAERRSALSLARQQLADSVLHAPIDGAVRERLVSVGEYLAAGSPVVRLVRIHPLRLRVAVPERDAAAIRVGQEVRVHLEGDSMEHAGRVARLSPAIQEQNRTLVVEAEVANRQGVLRPGAFARAEIVVEAARPAVLVPVKAIVTFAGLERVFGVKDGLAVEKRIRTGRRVGDRVEVLDGLASGEQVVVEPGNLTGGQPVIPKQ